MEKDTLPKLFLANCEKWGNEKVYMRNKDRGIWQKYTWEDCYQHIKYFALGLASLGFKRGDKLCIIGDNEPQWYWSEYAAQSLGGVVAGIFVDCVLDEVKYILVHSDSSFVVARDQEQVDKILAVREECPLVRAVIYWDYKGMWAYEDNPFVMSYEEVEEEGKEFEKEHPDLLEQEVEKGKGEDICALCYSSGTTGLPKGAMIRHRNLIGTVSNWFSVDPWTENDNYLSYVTPAWITEQMFGIAAGLVSGATINFPEEPETAVEDFREIGPSMVLYSPKMWESLYSTVESKMMEADIFKRGLYRLFLPVGYKVAELQSEAEEMNLFWKAMKWLADQIVLGPLRDKIGLLHTTSPYTGGSYMSSEIFRFFRAIGVNLMQFYGGTEIGLTCCHTRNNVKFQTVGVSLPGATMKITEEGEILVKGDSVFAGYYKMPEKTKEIFTEDGYYRTGDAGFIDDDRHLIYYDRMADMMKLHDGTNFSPSFIEGILKFSPNIRDVLSVGKEYVVALIQIDFEIMGRWAERNHIPYTTFIDLSQKPQVYDLIEKDVVRLNKLLPDAARVKKFVCLHKEFDPDEAELTRTRKLRRDFVEKRYEDIINAMYEGKNEYVARSEVKYRDGRRGTVSTAVKIKTLF